MKDAALITMIVGAVLCGLLLIIEVVLGIIINRCMRPEVRERVLDRVTQEDPTISRDLANDLYDRSLYIFSEIQKWLIAISIVIILGCVIVFLIAQW